LEPQRGAIKKYKDKVFEMAEETGKKYFEESQKEKKRLFESVSDSLGDSFDQAPTASEKGGNVDRIFGDDDDAIF